ncbi:FeoA domain protein [Moorella thermoacetica]|uniref:FeoA family protein n=1 Tax=Neomoorella thermoacetica TaxID=1525 RepID=UPI00069D7A0D|nr:ferrous iron transport protein A [Moorella thermoacetica]AKX93956.1 FeoA domain protein [Moorella thermoacetica]
MTLDKAKKGQRIRILALPGPGIRAQAIRFGIAEGELVTCTNIIPGGPIIIAKNHQEIAIGRGLAEKITVEPVAAPAPVKSLARRRIYGLPRS